MHDRTDEALDLLGRSEKLLGNGHFAYQIPEHSRVRARAHASKGELERAIMFADKAVNIAAELEMANDVAVGHRVRGTILATAGECQPALTELQESLNGLPDSDLYERACTELALAHLIEVDVPAASSNLTSEPSLSLAEAATLREQASAKIECLTSEI